jgi:hypothetical protein
MGGGLLVVGCSNLNLCGGYGYVVHPVKVPLLATSSGTALAAAPTKIGQKKTTAVTRRSGESDKTKRDARKS